MYSSLTLSELILSAGVRKYQGFEAVQTLDLSLSLIQTRMKLIKDLNSQISVGISAVLLDKMKVSLSDSLESIEHKL